MNNIVVIFTDQQRVDTLGFRNPLCETPHMDRIFENGISFDNCITPSPLCTPARASVFTGKYPHQVKGVLPPKGTMIVDDEIRVGDNTMMTNDYIMDIPPVFTELLKKSDYQVNYAGKWHLGNEIIHDWFENACGYDTKEYSKWCKENNLEDGWAFNDMSVRSKRSPHMSIPVAAQMNINPKYHGDAWIIDKGIDYIKNREKNRPFFTVCALNGPHPPFKVPEPYLSYYDKIKSEIPCPPNFSARNNLPKYFSDNYYRKLSEDYSTDWKNWQDSVAAYWGLVKLIDDQVGKVWKCLEDENILDDTTVILISDHGELMGSHGLWHKMECFEESVRVPFIVSTPRGVKCKRSDATSSLIDFVPTVLDIAGIEYNKGDFEGDSLYHQIMGECEDDIGRFVYSEHRPLGVFHNACDWRMVCDKQYKYVWSNGDMEQLYDLKNDPYELNNIALKSDIIDKYRKELSLWAKKTNDPLKDTIIKNLKSMD